VDEFFNGPLFLWLGPHSNKIATFTDLQPEINSSVSPQFKKDVLGTPSCVHSTFGDGDVVLFASHPEIVINISILLDRFEWDGDPYYGRRTVHNALFYVTSDPLKNIETINDYPLAFIEMIGEKTINLSYLPINESAFENIQTRLKKLNGDLSILRNISKENIELFSEYFNEKLLENSYILYPARYTFYYCSFYSDYNNKTLSDLEKLGSVYPLLAQFDDSVQQRIDALNYELSDRLNHSENLVLQIIIIANNLKYDLENKRTFVQKLQIISNARNMLRTFEIGMKYIPQTHFETLKLVRYCWYNYEAYKAITT